ncbi:MAG TPA: hypothetical protein ENJ34_02745, partial [Epsilonproteobacteria bacterium]|nr:hypothetical protein [Campylobacterota bacterium]
MELNNLKERGNMMMKIRLIGGGIKHLMFFAVIALLIVGCEVPNQSPTANTGQDQTVTEGETATLNCVGSDTDGTIVGYRWLEGATELANTQSHTTPVLSTGAYTYTCEVTDKDGAKGTDTVVVTVEARLVSLELVLSQVSLDINATATLTVTANYSDNTTLNMRSNVEWIIDDDTLISVDANGTLKALKSGTTTLQAKKNGIVSNTVSIEVKTPIALESLSISPNPVALRVGKNVQLSLLGTYSDGSTQVMDAADFTVDDPTVAVVDPTGTLDALSVGSTSLRAKVGSRYSGLLFVTVGKELNTTNFNATHFGSAYTDNIPVDATLDSYDEKRFCMLTGRIVSEDGAPLQGVKVSIHAHPEYGTLLTDVNGTYYFGAEGGLTLTMRYSKAGYTTLDRKINAPVQDWGIAPQVMMLEEDTKTTAIDLSNPSTPQVHTSTMVTDDRGERCTALVFKGVSRVTVTAEDGSSRILTNFAVKATEFKTPTSMPSDLPTESAYTYCADLKVEGTSDTDDVTFDAPVVMYVDNFLGFDVGEVVPVGYYDRKEGKWKASDNGVVVKLLDMDNDGKVDALDSTGDDQPNDLDGDGDFADEVAGIADNATYTAGKTYWRAEMMHFTPWDHNWPYGPPFDAVNPPKTDTSSDDNPKNDNPTCTSSYVTKKSRVFHEDIPIAGTDITLHYSSKRVGGYTYIIDASVNTTNAPASVKKANVTLKVAGRTFKKTVTLGELNGLTFEWDGKDASGRSMSGEVTATIQTKYVYPSVYYSGADFGRAWARAGSRVTGVRGRMTIDYASPLTTIRINVDTSTNKNSKMGNGWTLSNVHDMGTNTIYKGDGKKIEKFISLEDGLVAYYRFEGDAKDSSGQNNHGIEHGGIRYIDGVIGKSAKFDGIDDWVGFNNKIVNTVEFSVSGYIKLNNTNSSAI